MAAKLSQLPLATLRRMLAATERAAGKESVSVAVIRREIERREAGKPLVQPKGAAQMPERALTVRDLCERFHVGEHTALAWIRSGELAAVDVSRKRGGRPRWRATCRTRRHPATRRTSPGGCRSAQSRGFANGVLVGG